MGAAAVIRVFLGLVAVLALLCLLAWGAKRSRWVRKLGNKAQIDILGVANLGGRQRIAVVAVDDARLVIGLSPGHIALLHCMPDAKRRAPAGAATPETASEHS